MQLAPLSLELPVLIHMSAYNTGKQIVGDRIETWSSGDELVARMSELVNHLEGPTTLGMIGYLG